MEYVVGSSQIRSTSDHKYASKKGSFDATTIVHEANDGSFSANPSAREYVLANHQTMSLMDLSEVTGVRYTTIAEFLRIRGLVANRYSRKRRNLQPIWTK